MIGFLLSSALALAVDFRAPDAALAGFQLEQPAPEPQPEPEPNKPGLLFQLLGYGAYAGAGTYSGSSLYRESRTQGFWDPTIENVYARIGTATAAAEASNLTSEMLYRRGNKPQAWMLRVGSVLVYGFMSGHNFNKGWRRE